MYNFFPIELLHFMNAFMSFPSPTDATQELEPVSTPTETIQPSTPTPSPTNNVDLDNIKSEKESVERELDIQITENRRLSRMTVELSEKIETLETTISRLQGESLDRSSLFEQIQSDKDTLSRALQQNKKLKEQLVELEDGFVKMVSMSYWVFEMHRHMRNKETCLHFPCFEILAFENSEVKRLISRKWRLVFLFLKIVNYANYLTIKKWIFKSFYFGFKAIFY